MKCLRLAGVVPDGCVEPDFLKYIGVCLVGGVPVSCLVPERRRLFAELLHPQSGVLSSAVPGWVHLDLSLQSIPYSALQSSMVADQSSR